MEDFEGIFVQRPFLKADGCGLFVRKSRYANFVKITLNVVFKSKNRIRFSMMRWLKFTKSWAVGNKVRPSLKLTMWHLSHCSKRLARRNHVLFGSLALTSIGIPSILRFCHYFLHPPISHIQVKLMQAHHLMSRIEALMKIVENPRFSSLLLASQWQCSAKSCPVVVLGDMNSLPLSEVYMSLRHIPPWSNWPDFWIMAEYQKNSSHCLDSASSLLWPILLIFSAPTQILESR